MRLRIVPVAAAHASDIERLAADPEVAATCNLPHPYPIGGGERFVRQAQRRWQVGTDRVFAIVVAGAVAGVVSLNALDRDPYGCTVNYWVGRPFWGRGLGTAAVAAALGHAAAIGRRRVASACLIDNPASARVLLKNGLREGPNATNDGAWGGKFRGATMRTFSGQLIAAGRS